MPSMVTVAVLVLALAGCAGPRPSEIPSVRPPKSFDARDFRQPVVFVRVDVRSGQMPERRSTDLPGEYQGLLLEGLNARAIAPRDVTVVRQQDALDNRVAVARARETGADHALLVDVALAVRPAPFCRDTRRAFTAQAFTVLQRVVVVRAIDGAVRWEPEAMETVAIDADCENPRESRHRSPTETMQAAVDRLLTRLLGS